MGPTLVRLLIGFVVLALLLGPLERLWPAIRGRRVWRRGLGTDLAYWLFTPFVTRTGAIMPTPSTACSSPKRAARA